MNGERHVKGILYYKNGIVYEGEFVHGQKKGNGQCRFPSGSIYTGEWLTLMNGFGVLEKNDGTKYIGQWKNGKIDGMGDYYDSQGKLSYAMLAELNSVVPTFTISADAPTETLIAPHFDDRSTNVLYNLHTQPSWGMRIKKADESISESDGLRYMSDADDKSAIYYNKKGFDPSIITISDKYGVGDNNLNGVSEDRWGWKPGQPDVIDVLSTGKSGTLYNQYVKDENGNN